MCNDCYDPVIEAIQKCSYDDECLQAETGFCYSCMCNVFFSELSKFNFHVADDLSTLHK